MGVSIVASALAISTSLYSYYVIACLIRGGQVIAQRFVPLVLNTSLMSFKDISDYMHGSYIHMVVLTSTVMQQLFLPSSIPKEKCDMT